VADRFRLTARAGHPGLLDLPWDQPLAAWDDERLVDVVRGVSRHVVRFVALEGRVYCCKETEEPLARREYGLLRRLADRSLPAVEAVAVLGGRHDARGEPLGAVLVTRHLEHSLPYRYLFGGRGLADARRRLIDALALLLVRLHADGVFWGDCSLSNTLFRRDAGALSAYLVDAETAEIHDALSDGQRTHDLMIATENVAGELLDLAAHERSPSDVDPLQASEDLERAYAHLWAELTRVDWIDPAERYLIDARVERLHELGFDVEELELVSTDDGHRLRIRPQVVESGHHARRLRNLTGLDVQENQARRLLNDIAAYAAAQERAGAGPVPSGVAAAGWLEHVFRPAVALVPDDLRSRLAPAEVFHEVLEHRWFLSEARGRDVGTEEATRSYIDTVLRFVPDEHRLLPDPHLDADPDLDVDPQTG
jgi:hypothetical protein